MYENFKSITLVLLLQGDIVVKCNNVQAGPLSETFFAVVSCDATKFPAPPNAQSKYPFVARVVPSGGMDSPTMCAAACIQPRIMITAARCVIGLTVGMASVYYQNKLIKILAIVVPSDEDRTKQSFDDIGVIVTEPVTIKDWKWPTINLFNMNRTDDKFMWFERLKYEYGPIEHELVTYIEKHMYKASRAEFFTLDVHVGIHFCQKIYSRNNELSGYFVPCVGSCTYTQFMNYFSNKECDKMFSCEGSLVIHKKKKHLLGIVTWGSKEVKSGPTKKLPVGIAIPNSKKFWNDLSCAIKIREYKGKNKRLQSVCGS